MMDSQFEIKLIECLSLLEEGEPIERVLARYPDDALSLRPLLETARMLPSLRREPAESARQASRRAFLNEASRLSEARLRRWAWFSPRLAMTLASVLVVFVLVGGVAAAAQSALPDDTLYSVKRALEDTRLLLAPQGDRATLASSLSQRRRDEIGQLLASGRSASVAFEGKIEMIAARRWQIAGLPVQIAAGTRISGVPAVGARAQVQGHTAAGQLLADSITIEPGSLPAATVTATASPTAQPTPSPTAQPSATELVRPTATIRPSTLPAPSAAPTARPTSAPAPTQAPAPTRPPEPTQAPEPEVEVEFEGVVEAIGSAWRVGGQTVAIDGATEIRDAINVGDTVRVRALRRADGQLIARRIDLRSDTSGGNDNANGNDDHGGDNSGSNDNANGNDDHGGGDNSGSGGGGGGDDNGGGGGGGGHGGGHGGGSDDNNSGKA